MTDRDILDKLATHHDQLLKLTDDLACSEALDGGWTARRLLLSVCETLRLTRAELALELEDNHE